MAVARVYTDDLLGDNPLPDFNPDEQRYSVHVRATLLRMLRGELDTLDLMCKYHQEPGRLGAVPLPETVNPKKLRLDRVEEILSRSIRFLHDGSDGGPIAQVEDAGNGIIQQVQDFPTRFPHIVIERTDTYDKDSSKPRQSIWCVHRVQNQRRNVRLNRVLDVMNLGVAILQLGR